MSSASCLFLEQVEEALHIGNVGASRFVVGSVAYERGGVASAVYGAVWGRGGALDLGFVPQVVVQRGRVIELEEEAAELQTRHLMGGDDLEPREVFVLRLVAVHHFRHVNGGAFRSGSVRRRPAYVAPYQIRGRRQADFFAGQAPAVHFHYLLDAIELYAGRERFQHRLGVGGLYLEVGKPAVRVLAQEVDALVVPAL